MNKKDLLKLIEQLPDDADIEVGCESENDEYVWETQEYETETYLSFTSHFGAYLSFGNVYRLCTEEDKNK